MSIKPGATVDHIYPKGSPDRPLCRKYRDLPAKSQSLNDKMCENCQKKLDSLEQTIKSFSKEQAEQKIENRVERKRNYLENKVKRLENNLKQAKRELENMDDFHQQIEKETKQNYREKRRRYKKRKLKWLT